MKPLPYARLVLPVVLGLGLLALAVAMIAQGSARPASPSASSTRPATPAGTARAPLAEGPRPSLTWPLAMVVVVGLGAAACWQLYTMLRRVRRQRDAEAERNTHMRRRLDEAQTLNARLHGELERRMEQVKSLDAKLSAARSSQQTPLRAPRPLPAAVASGEPLGNGGGQGGPRPLWPADPYPSHEETLVGPAGYHPLGNAMHLHDHDIQGTGQTDDCNRRDEELRDLTKQNAELLQKWRDSERARLEEHEALRREHEEALARLHEQARVEQQQIEARFALRIRELEAECEELRASLEHQGARVWPPAFQEPQLAGLRKAIARGMEVEPPMPEAVGLFGMIHQFCASAGSERTRETAFEMSRAFYLWCYAAGQASAQWEEQLARWLTDFLRSSRVRVVAVKPGEPVSARLHSPEGNGHQVRRPLSFLVLREDGTPYKRALVAT